MNKNKLIIVPALVILLLGVNSAISQKTNISGRITSGPTISLVTVAIDKFQLDNNLTTSLDTIVADSLRQVLKNDLIFTMYFNVVEPDSAFLVDMAGNQMTLDDWIYVGAQMLIKGRLSRSEALFTLNIDVIDPERNKLTYSHEFLGEISRYRYLAHRAADDLLLNLTGEKSVFFSKIVYGLEDGDNSNIFVCDFDGFNPVQITKGVGEAHPLNILPTWGSNGNKIYFTSYRKGNPDLYSYNFATNDFAAVSSRQGLNYAGMASPDGKYIAAVLSFGNNSEIYLLDLSGKIIQQITYSYSIDTSPTWSPNSKQIAFVSDRSGSPQVYVVDIDGSNIRRLTYLGDYNSDPAWSPRGDLIAYSTRENGIFQIYTVDITGQNTNKLTDLGSNESPSWSPDGLHIIYTSDADGAYGLWVVNLDGSGNKKLPLKGICKSPDWSINLH